MTLTKPSSLQHTQDRQSLFLSALLLSFSCLPASPHRFCIIATVLVFSSRRYTSVAYIFSLASIVELRYSIFDNVL
ncbi:hypothetical protein B0T25DRAFT_78056 [Lasiosphaeria hispida]|uniref:Uncharacterized protein n=1 Tax=Lasiosphaeria hispida TaxID=260671 RepID=A0AAJ0HP31_9PEZI|nr:hypothetical protein B0T25DRAFT_78056 [Lasiosphaeria hispida]